MTIGDAVRRLLGIAPVSIGELNQRAVSAGQRAQPKPRRPGVPPPNVEVSPEFERVLELIAAKVPIIFVTGKAGTGKSTLVRYLRDVCTGNVVVVAPTGVAALNVEGVTIHSFFRLPPKIITSDDVKHVTDRKLYSRLDLLLVDEVSMVRADVIDGMDNFLRRNGRDSGLPFGGTQVVFVGDLFQLPPVVSKNEKAAFDRLYESPFFFSAKAIQTCSLVPVELQRIYRQRDADFATMLNALRVAEDVDAVVDRLNAMCPTDGADALITLTCTNAVADGINESYLAKLPGTAQVFTGSTTGKFHLEGERLPSPSNLNLKQDAHVMFTKNDTAGQWVNGTMGRVAHLSEDAIQVELLTDDPGRIIDVGRVTWESYRYEFDPIENRIVARVVGEYTQFPLMLAWAVTIHKGQGKTLERVHVDLGHGAFTAGQAYVALSRCRSLKDISLERPIRSADVWCDERIRRFYDALQLRRQDGGAQ